MKYATFTAIAFAVSLGITLPAHADSACERFAASMAKIPSAANYKELDKVASDPYGDQEMPYIQPSDEDLEAEFQDEYGGDLDAAKKAATEGTAMLQEAFGCLDK